MDNYYIRKLYGSDLQTTESISKEGNSGVEEKSRLPLHSIYTSVGVPGFLETLSALSNVGTLSRTELGEIYRCRLKIGVETYVGINLVEQRIISTGSIFFERKFIHTGGIAAFIEDVAVHKDYQKLGLGSTIVNRLIERAKEVGAYKIVLACSDDNIPFYNKFGFYHNCANMRMDLIPTKDYSEVD